MRRGAVFCFLATEARHRESIPYFGKVFNYKVYRRVCRTGPPPLSWIWPSVYLLTCWLAGADQHHHPSSLRWWPCSYFYRDLVRRRVQYVVYCSLKRFRQTYCCWSDYLQPLSCRSPLYALQAAFESVNLHQWFCASAQGSSCWKKDSTLEEFWNDSAIDPTVRYCSLRT